MTKLLGIIPARAGSKRVVNKNKVDLGGMPLIGWTIKAARTSRIFDKIVMTTNDRDIATFGGQCNLDVILRPDELAQGEHGSMKNTLFHAFGLCEWTGPIMLLQPTSPFRTARHIREAWETYKRCKSDSLVSCGYQGQVNGAIYIMAYERVKRGAEIYDERTPRYMMDMASSLDINTEADLARARRVVAESMAAAR